MVGIARFSRECFGDRQTKKYLQQIEAAITRAIEFPSLIRPRPELGEDVHSVRCLSHVAFSDATARWRWMDRHCGASWRHGSVASFGPGSGQLGRRW
jgi:plasmid stabilization system protein ParE